MKTVNTRDAATAIIRKMGIAKADYSKFIAKSGDKFTVNIKAAEESLRPAVKEEATSIKITESVDAKNARLADKARKDADKPAAREANTKAAISAAKKVLGAKLVTKTEKPAKTDRKVTETPTEAELKSKGKYIRRLISLGYTNSEVWTDIKDRFELDDTKKYYPGWYRFDMRRQGFDV